VPTFQNRPFSRLIPYFSVTSEFQILIRHSGFRSLSVHFEKRSAQFSGLIANCLSLKNEESEITEGNLKPDFSNL